MIKKTIKLKKYLDVIEEYQATNVAITPGALLELTSDDLVQAHSEDGGLVLPMFALEDELQGKEINDNYVANDKIQVWVAVRGEIVNALIAEDEVVTVGDFLVSNGDGTLRVLGSTDTGTIVGQAVEALDMTDSEEAAIGRCAVRIF